MTCTACGHIFEREEPKLALRNDDITLYGDGLQSRSFCYVDDLIDGMMRMMDTQAGITGPINLGNPHEFTMLELAETILKLTASKSRLAFHPLPQDDPRQRQPDISLARSTLDWSPSISLEDGLRETVEYFRRTLNI